MYKSILQQLSAVSPQDLKTGQMRCQDGGVAERRVYIRSACLFQSFHWAQHAECLAGTEPADEGLNLLIWVTGHHLLLLLLLLLLTPTLYDLLCTVQVRPLA